MNLFGPMKPRARRRAPVSLALVISIFVPALLCEPVWAFGVGVAVRELRRAIELPVGSFTVRIDFGDAGIAPIDASGSEVRAFWGLTPRRLREFLNLVTLYAPGEVEGLLPDHRLRDMAIVQMEFVVDPSLLPGVCLERQYASITLGVPKTASLNQEMDQTELAILGFPELNPPSFSLSLIALSEERIAGQFTIAAAPSPVYNSTCPLPTIHSTFDVIPEYAVPNEGMSG